MRRHFQMFAAYNSWANGLVYDVAAKLSDDDYRRDMGAFFKSVHGTLNHIMVADRIWMKRFTAEGDHPKTLDAILFQQLAALRSAREAEDRRIIAFVGSLDDRAFTGRFTYITATDVRTVSQRLAPALSHFFNHQTHHRGQVHAMLTALGQDVPSLDLIQFQRTETGRMFA
ncbi:damage-inducible protein DinB [Phyllobacterium salinisoli]|uniref:Damage-inducible protein DinB n=1 Tax=Phyllobacterium salinisoli TaxID=1899321 RepID=A0A368K1A4_9HYPH|nr:DinB family protein [Phyllobacterium salinisoli]RCS23159.1 damage-inducible protein DinB [Phyllobacterium salinisoli]